MNSAPAPPPQETRGHWRQPYLLLVELSWWRFLALVTTLYLLINLLFAGLYLLDPGGIGGGGRGGGDLPLTLRAFFLSVETLATIGYGSLYPNSLWVHLVTTGEAITGLILVALITGLAFARFARTPQSVEFGERARIEALDGRECLVIQLHNSRRNTLFDVRVRVFWQPQQGERQLEPLPLLTPD
ncbi:MAG: ion channel, partial [Prochlorococcaceae cyanobacterium]